jgi:hypothetical protein
MTDNFTLRQSVSGSGWPARREIRLRLPNPTTSGSLIVVHVSMKAQRRPELHVADDRESFYRLIQASHGMRGAGDTEFYTSTFHQSNGSGDAHAVIVWTDFTDTELAWISEHGDFAVSLVEYTR